MPFTVGGAEKLYWGLQEHINKNTAHQCELIKIPVKEDNFWNLIDSYYKFYTLDVSYFDAVITSKYPAWMVKHHCHHVYMLHCLRGLYDTYDFFRFSDEVDSALKLPEAGRILNYIDTESRQNDAHNASSSIEGLFRLLFELKNKIYSGSADAAYMRLCSFPGPFIKEIIHFFDRKAMQAVKSFSAISKTVAGRKEYFPEDAKINIIYPPSNLTNFKNESSDYFFTVSRLDEAKRIKMIVEAYLKTDADALKMPLKIAGAGPLENELKELSKNDNRVKFTGFLSDKELIDYYARSIAVIFVPFEEDYGLVTLEAMMSEKPVITFTDSGGVKEFVENGKTGIICEPNVNSLKRAIEKLGKDIVTAQEMGRNAKRNVENVTWENTFNRLFDIIASSVAASSAAASSQEKPLSSPQPQRKKIVLATTYPVFPPRGGGQNRIFYLYKEMANYFDVELITLTGENDTGFRKEIAPGLIENRIPKSKEFAHKEYHEIQKKIGIPAADIAMLYFYEDLNDYREAVKKYGENADYLIASHPYPYYILNKFTRHILIHESHNVEYTLKRSMVQNNDAESGKILSYLFDTEKEICSSFDLTAVCAIDDAYKMQELYGLDLKRAVEVPNGVDLETVKFVPIEKRRELKNRLGIGKEKIILFIGSWHQPNIDAVKKIIAYAEKLLKYKHEYKFIILGSVGGYFKNNKTNKTACPDNVGFAGVSDDYEKELYLSIADLAINPMESGSGTNLKMLDYMASGVPVLSTPVGARGLKLTGAGDLDKNLQNGFINLSGSGIDDFSDAVVNSIENYEIDKLLKARKFMEANFDWKIIAKNFKNYLIDLKK